MALRYCSVCFLCLVRAFVYGLVTDTEVSAFVSLSDFKHSIFCDLWKDDTGCIIFHFNNYLHLPFKLRTNSVFVKAKCRSFVPSYFVFGKSPVLGNFGEKKLSRLKNRFLYPKYCAHMLETRLYTNGFNSSFCHCYSTIDNC